MKIRTAILLCLCSNFGFGFSAVAQSDLSSKPGTRVVLRGLDKVTASTHDFEVKIGEISKFGALTIKPFYCRKRPPEETPEVFAFLTIHDRATDGTGQEVDGIRVFNGWMFASSPALNPLEHPVYDVWVLDCK
ncbi:MAG: DUF2155 domain-containing protein [Robiginitomaculum sp.]|nr:DUF2155 domain-containing protein [Robiginitomaculum sp.]